MQKNILLLISKILIMVFAIVMVFFCTEVLFRFYIINIAHSNFKPNSVVELPSDTQYIQSFHKTYPQGVSSDTFNVYFLGESTMQGVPYPNVIPLLIAKMTDSQINNKKITWINLGKEGINIAESKRRVAWVLQNRKETKPNLFILYSGHNEFLAYQKDIGIDNALPLANLINTAISKSYVFYWFAQQFHLFKLDIDNHTFFEKPTLAMKEKQKVLNNYQNQIQEIAQAASNNNIPIIISTAASNFSDFEPNVSVYCSDQQADKNQFKYFFDIGKEAENKQDFQRAKDFYLQAYKLCDSFAELNYRLGRVSMSLNQNEDANLYFNNAVDTDQMPMRALTYQNNSIKTLATYNKVIIVDAVQALLDQSSHGLIGYNYMIDGHHPNIEGYTIIAYQITQAIQSVFPQTTITQLDNNDVHKIFLANKMQKYWEKQSEAEWFIRISTWRYDPTDRIKKAQQYLEDAQKIDPGAFETDLDKMIIFYLTHDRKSAEKLLNKSMHTNMRKTIKFILTPWISQIILRAYLSKG